MREEPNVTTRSNEESKEGAVKKANSKTAATVL
jgi:hypothetical protein